MTRFCLGVHACDVPVLALDDPAAHDAVARLCAQVVAEDEPDALVLGCAGMAGLRARVEEETGVPVVDGVAAATLTVQSLLVQGLRTGARGEFAAPPPKRYAGVTTADRA
ncbi:hydantoin racemase [Rhodococcus rhodnii LMG 5362]|uniref:Hydantoin racemase n=1 Tax=Rhodococcus rhodnii LMG 5362 TaxID=1273125 RepID=R7WQF7_9NOCA|nr:hydantoin racemase [Rhodococcus rhodnii LMG 5362]